MTGFASLIGKPFRDAEQTLTTTATPCASPGQRDTTSIPQAHTSNSTSTKGPSPAPPEGSRNERGRVVTEPYYSDDYERACECGCGHLVSGSTRNGPRRYVSGHNLNAHPPTEKHRAALAEAAREAWRTKRKRKPIGSRRKDANGYWLVKTREGGGGRWDKEHILVAEQAAGRSLNPGEHVHHINCIRDDNRPENLIILSAGEHTSAHHSLNDLVAGLLDAGVIRFDADAGIYRHA